MKDLYKQVKINGKKMRLHRHLVEQSIGRPLLRTELIHHINGDKRDNRIENLEITDAKKHSLHHQQKYPLTKDCVVCSATFTPAPTKRGRKQTCSKKCRYDLIGRLLSSKRELPLKS